MKNLIEFQLKQSFRDPVNIEAEETVFKGRKNEIRRLKSLIMFRKSASILISGVRGIGKTAFVHEALRQTRKELETTFPIIDITFANIVGNKPNETKLRKDILNSLIRGLWLNQISQEKAGTQLEKLYDKTFISDLKTTGILETSKQEIITSEKKDVKEQILKLDFSPTFEVAAKVTGVTISVGYLLELLNFLSINWNWWQLTIFGTLFAGIISLILMTKIEIKTVYSFLKGVEDKVAEKISGSKSAKYDLSADTLESELKQILRTLEETGSKAIFVIDELDKLDDPKPDKFDESLVYVIVKTFKNLFSLSNAIFIFITGDEFFDRLEDQRSKNPYSTFHTIFTDKIFLNSLYYKDIENIIDNFKEGEINKKYDKNYQKFKSYISWKAKNHIFDTHNLIEEFTQRDKSGKAKVIVF